VHTESRWREDALSGTEGAQDSYCFGLGEGSGLNTAADYFLVQLRIKLIEALAEISARDAEEVVREFANIEAQVATLEAKEERSADC
jgi:hypothetical protein